MSDSDFEFIDASQVVTTQRQRKPKYKHRLWEDTSDYGRFRYYSALQSMERRRNKTNETKYDHLINPRMEYEQWWIDNTPSDYNPVEIQNVEVVYATCEYCSFDFPEKESVDLDGHTICESCSEKDLYVCESCLEIYDYLDMRRGEDICFNCEDSEE